jgi:uncharacterized protein with ParB-like and HNH nuclease domain
MPQKSETKPISEGDRRKAEIEIKERQRGIDYDSRAFTIDYIVQQFNDDELYIPNYQRPFVWRDRQKMRFIESVILGVPISAMLFAADDGRLAIIDGGQRIQTLEAFLNDDLRLSELEKLPSLNGFTFSDLPTSQQRKFVNRMLRVVVFEATTTDQTLLDIFERINTSGVKARSSEIRRGTYKGHFMDFVSECAEDGLFVKLCPMSDTMWHRQEVEELVVRFFAYSDRYKSVRHDVDKFLDKYVQEHQDTFDKERFKSEFDNMLNFVNRFIPNGFAKSKEAKTIPRVRFEAIAVGVNLALRKKPDLIPTTVDWLKSEEFKYHTTTHANNSGQRLRARIEFVRDALLAGAK